MVNTASRPDGGAFCASHRMLFFIGPRKTGTSWINAYLEARGDVVTPRTTKETFFFDRYFARGTDWYEAQFPPPAAPDTVFAECAPSYASNPLAIRRICETVPNAVFVVTLREPVARVQSHWRHLIRYGHAQASPLDAMSADSELLRDSHYADILASVIAICGAERVRILVYEDLRRDPVSFARALCRATDLPEQDPDPEQGSTRMNTAQKPRNRRLSALVSKAAETLRNAGLHRVVRMARKAGLRRVLERPYNPGDSAMDEATRQAVRRRLEPQMSAAVTCLTETPSLAPAGREDALARTLRAWSGAG